MLNVYRVVDKIPVETLKKFNGLPDYVVRFLLNRGITSYDEYQDLFLQAHLESPMLLADTKAGTNFLLQKIQEQKSIVIYGDYDADGIISAYILYDFIRNVLNYSKVSIWLPNRFHDGYGLNKDVLSKIAKFAQVVITVDCGIRDKAIIEEFGDKLEFMIIDHHELPDELPNVPVIHPMHPKGKNKNKVTSAGITVFKFVSYVALILNGIKQARSLDKNSGLSQDLEFIDSHLARYLDIAPITIATDVMPVLGENRVFIKLALSKIKQLSSYSPIQKILEFLELDRLKVSFKDFGFVIGPRLNATGRLYDPSLGLYLILKPQSDIVEIVNKINNERKELIDTKNQNFEFSTIINNFVIVYDSNLSEGIIGLIAARLVQKFGLPSIVITRTADNKLKGSARSISSVNITKIFSEIADVFDKYGGHAAAAGFTLASDIEGFIDALKHVNIKIEQDGELLADDLLDISQINRELVGHLHTLEPFGPLNDKFILLVRAFIDNIGLTNKGKVVLKLRDVNKDAFINAYMTKELFSTKLQNKIIPGRTYYFVVNIFGGENNYSYNLWIEDIADSLEFI